MALSQGAPSFTRTMLFIAGGPSVGHLSAPQAWSQGFQSKVYFPGLFCQPADGLSLLRFRASPPRKSRMREIRTPGSTGHEAHSPLPIPAKLVQPPVCNVLKQHNTITTNWQPGSDAILRKSLDILGIWNGKALPPATFPQPVSSRSEEHT